MPSLICQSTSGGTLRARYSSTVDCQPVSPTTAKTLTVSEKMGKGRQMLEEAITRELPCHYSEPRKGHNSCKETELFLLNASASTSLLCMQS